MHLLSEHKLIFGFSSVLTKFSIETLGSREFVRSMIELGCAIGFYNDFIPYTRDDRNVLPDKEQMSTFKENLYHIRRREPAVLLHLPEDEYDETGRCSAVGKGSVHINATGDVEPCPFAHFARENITSHSFKDILRSPFLQAIREHPDALIRGEVGCSLFSNYPILEDIAQCTGARCTARSSDCSLQS
jgi:MoaA/NifB/PqqE/SkfB family radical SAM enzyme